MISIKRNQVIIAALVVMIGVAGYLSYIDRPQKAAQSTDDGVALTSTGEVSALIYDSSSGQDVPVVNMSQQAVTSDNGETAISTTSDSGGSGGTDTSAPGDAVFVNQTDDTSYFVQEKLDREQARAQQKDMLMEMINSDSVSADQKSECADKILTLQDRLEKETGAEALIEAKGFGDSYVRIDDTTVDVVVTKDALTDAEIAQIEDIVKRETGMSSDQIRISSFING